MTSCPECHLSHDLPDAECCDADDHTYMQDACAGRLYCRVCGQFAPREWQVASLFCEYVRRELDPPELDALDRGEAVPDDYCDANEVMREAIEDLGYAVPEMADGPDPDGAFNLWTAAYAIAHDCGYNM